MSPIRAPREPVRTTVPKTKITKILDATPEVINDEP